MTYDLPTLNTITIQVGTPLTEVERLVIEATLQCAGWNMSRCARILGIDFGSLYLKLKAYYIAELAKESASSKLGTQAKLDMISLR